MKRIIKREESREIINLLRQKQPRTLKDFNKAFNLREFKIKKILKELETEKVIIRESHSGIEKFWLNVNQTYDFLSKNPIQKKRLKHSK